MKLLLFMYGWIVYVIALMVTMLASDAFVTNLPMIITAVCGGIATILGAIGLLILNVTRRNAADAKTQAIEAVKLSRENQTALEDVKKGVDGVVTKLMETKDKVAEAKEQAQKLADAKDAGINEGELKAIKERTLKDAPPVK